MADNGVIKVIVIGDSLVGKTSFIQRYVNKTFRPEYKSTIGVDFALKIIPWIEPYQIKLQLWDIAGQERFTYMTRAYYKDAKACILMFDLTSESSFQKVTKWKQDLDSKSRLPDGSHLPCLLVGNKVDLEKREVSHARIAKVCEDMSFAGWTETSAKEGIMVDESIRYILDVITGNIRRRKYRTMTSSDMTESIKLKSTPPEQTEEKKCPC